MLGKRFQRTVSMAQIGPAGTTCNPTTEEGGAGAISTDGEQPAISQWEILKHAEEMMMRMMGARSAGGAEASVPSAAAAVMSSAVQAEAAIRTQHKGGGGLIPRAHFLENCFFCKRRLKHERDIFIYRGDAAFCSEECRQRQIMKDEMRSMGTSSKKGDATSETAVAA